MRQIEVFDGGNVLGVFGVQRKCREGRKEIHPNFAASIFDTFANFSDKLFSLQFALVV